MRDLKGCLQSILRDTVVEVGPNDEGCVTLRQQRETGRSLMQVQIKDVPSTTTVISLDNRARQLSILKQAKGAGWLKT